MKKLQILFLALLIANLTSAQLNSQWDEAYGGSESEVAYGAVQTPDGGFIVVGSTDSEGSGKLDGYIVKINANGVLDWTNTYGGSKDDEFKGITAINGNYAICGYSESKGSGKKDMWLLVIDNNGQKLWEYFYGGEKDEEANDIITSFDNNLVMAGYTKSKGAGNRDFWMLMVNPTGVGKELGKEIWSRNVGGSGVDEANRIKQNPLDSFFFVIGNSTSNSNGGMDVYFTRLSPDRGAARGKQNFGKKNFEHGNDFVITDTSGFLMVGGTMSDSKGFFDGWIMRIQTEYYKVWDNLSYGGTKEEEFVSVFQDGDDFVLGGFSQSFGEGKSDAWIMKIDNKGELIKENTFGEMGDEIIHRMIQTKDGGYLMVGSTDSKGEGKSSMWVIKVK